MVKDLDLFRAAMADVTPLKGRRPARRVVMEVPTAAPTKPAPKSSSKSAGRSALPAVKAVRVAVPALPVPPAFDRDVDRALSRGRRTPEAKLDLHGMTLVAAERAVARFLEEAVSLDMRVVLIVTGKGLRREGDRVFEGRIRAEFPAWLQRADNRGRVRGMKPAHPRHGGTGAFYVLLRRRSRD